MQGILRSDKFIQNAAEIPCDVIESLENDADAAQQFVEQIRQSQVPTIIEDLPQNIVHEFVGLVKVALALPSEIRDVAEAAVTDAVRIVNDIESGAITQEFKNLPSAALSEFSSAWGDLTDGAIHAFDAATHGVGCLFVQCTSSAPACLAAATVTATNTPAFASASPTSVPLTRALVAPTQSFNTSVTNRTLSAGSVAPGKSASSSSQAIPSNLGTNAASSPFESNVVKICALFFLAVLGVAILL